jgi:hypothetical protein
MADPLGESTPQQPEAGKPSSFSTLTSWLREHWRSVLVGALAGVPLGLWVGVTLGKGGLYVLGAYVLAGMVGLLFVALLIAGAIAKKRGPTSAAFVLGITFLVGIAASPAGWGTPQSVPGTGTAGTRNDPSALWSGSVTCDWTKGEDASISEIRDFEVRITDPELLAAEDLVENLAGIVYLERGTVLWWGWKTGSSMTSDCDWSAESAVELERMAPDARTGTAVMTEADIVFSWSCTGGP